MLSTGTLLSQELRIFKVADFDLKGHVKTCLVVTDYGKEEFDFNTQGLLQKSVTRYSDGDYDITQYKYDKANTLLEKRIENYRNDTFDKQTSMVYMYAVDTMEHKKITEKIITYNKEFLGQYEYGFDASNNLTSIVRTDNEGIDETKIEYTEYKGETTVTYKRNGVLQKSVRTSKNDKTAQRIVLTKIFLEGEPQKATEQVFDIDDMMISQIDFGYNPAQKQFIPEETKTYIYNATGELASVTTKTDKITATQEYIYQYDAGNTGNWVKQIITPDNTYTTRKIAYYEVVEDKEIKE